MPAVAGASRRATDSTTTAAETSVETMVDADGVAEGDGDGVAPGALGVVEGEPLLDGDARFVGESDG